MSHQERARPQMSTQRQRANRRGHSYDNAALVSGRRGVTLSCSGLLPSERGVGWMETAADVSLRPEKPPIPTVTPFLAGQAQHWQDTQSQRSRTFDQSTHFLGVFACFMRVCSSLLSETRSPQPQMGLAHVCSLQPQRGRVFSSRTLAHWELEKPGTEFRLWIWIKV